MPSATLDPTMPQVGDAIWAGRYYRRITEVVETMEDGRLKIRAYDPKEDRVVAMALTLPTPATAPARGKSGTRQRGEKPRLTPELRQKIEDGLACAPRGHDMTGAMPNGKPVLYIGPSGQRACRMCKAEAAERFMAKKGAASGAVSGGSGVRAEDGDVAAE